MPRKHIMLVPDGATIKHHSDMIKHTTLESYLRESRSKGIIVYDGDEHKGAINHLCMVGKLKPQDFTAHDGIRRTANCILSAVQWLKGFGQYDDNRNKNFVLVKYHETRPTLKLK